MSAEHAALARLARLVGLTRDATKHVSHRTSVLQLYRDASDVAEQRLPGPLGVGVAAVLAIAAENRRLSGVSGALGADQPTMALALAVLEIIPDDPVEQGSR